MVQLKIIIVSTTPAETLHLEQVLAQTGYLGKFHYVGLEQSILQVPDWGNWDLVIARYQDWTGSMLMSLLAPVLRKSLPPVFFLVDKYNPILVNQLLDNGSRRVLPLENLELMIGSAIEGVFHLGQFADREKANKFDSLATSPGQRNRSVLDRFARKNEGIARLFMHSPVGICITRQGDGKCVDCNESFARLLDWSRDELLGQKMLELGFPIEENSQSQAAGEKPSVEFGFERKIFNRAGLARNVQVHLDLIEWDGEDCVIALVQDITEKERAKEKNKRLNDELEHLVLVRTGALHAANQELAAEIGRRKYLEDFSNQLSQTLRETSDVVAISSPDWNVQFLNKAGRLLFGIAEDAPVSHLNLLFPYADEMRDRIANEVQPYLIKYGAWRGETEFKLPSGKIIPVSQVMICKKDDDGEILYYATIARDISDYKRVEQELRQSRELYRTLAEAAHDFIFMVSKEGLIEYANEYACRALGHDPSKVEGIPASQFFPREFAINHLQMFYEVHEIDRPVYTEGPFSQDEEEFWLGTWLVPIHNDVGSLISVLGISRDITEQKKTDEALQRALDNERRLGEIRSNFFSMTSHQFRTPLSTILLSAELLQKYGMNWDEKKRAEHLIRIQEAARRLNNMLEDILVIGRVESGRYVCAPKDFDLIRFVDQVVGEMSTNDQGKHTILFKHEMDEFPVFLDQEVLRRVLDNLLSNALKYSRADTQVTVELKIEDLFFLIEVTDQGIGIPEDDLKYLFQPFQRGSNAADFPGTGIGLTIIQKSVELMNGTVSVKSKMGLGTTFMVRFPARLVSSVDLAFV
ncbi:MAG: PAS domain S-box protein [Anaerolineaceae bacterium]|nr:PAS domain S-box protein [Anaerolineaceae bacterium]